VGDGTDVDRRAQQGHHQQAQQCVAAEILLQPGMGYRDHHRRGEQDADGKIEANHRTQFQHAPSQALEDSAADTAGRVGDLTFRRRPVLDDYFSLAPALRREAEQEGQCQSQCDVGGGQLGPEQAESQNDRRRVDDGRGRGEGHDWPMRTPAR
jgi:hypothetical protein